MIRTFKASVALLLTLFLLNHIASGSNMVVKNLKLYVDDTEFFIKAMCYNPSPLGQSTTGNGGGGFCSPKVTPYGTTTTTCYDSDYFDGGPNAIDQPSPPGGGWFQPLWERDFPMMKELGANTIRIYNTNPTTKQASIYFPQAVPLPLGKDHVPFMDLANSYGFKVIFPLISDYNMLTTYDPVAFKRLLRWQIDEVGNHPALLMWAFGNELPLFGNSDLVNLMNVYITYIKQYTLTKWGRKVPVSVAVVDLPNSYDPLAAILDVDIFTTNAGYRGFTFSDLWSGNSIFQGWFKLSCRYNKPVFIGEFGWQSENNAITYSNPDWFNQIWKDLVGHIDQGCIGGAFFEYSDERTKPSEQQTMGLVAPSVNSTGGLPSTQQGVWNADIVTRKDIIFNAVKSGSYQGVFYNMNSSPFYLIGRSQSTLSTSMPICSTFSTFKDCPADNTCSFHGLCDRQIGSCTCNSGWAGADCSQAVCTSGCSGNGVCDGSVSPPVCNCNAGWTGASCNVAVSVSSCNVYGNCASLNGMCDSQGVCRCYQGWRGHNCAIPDISYPPVSTTTSKGSTSTSTTSTSTSTSTSSTTARPTTSTSTSTSTSTTTARPTTSTSTSTSSTTARPTTSTTSSTTAIPTTSTTSSTTAVPSTSSTTSTTVRPTTSTSTSTSTTARPTTSTSTSTTSTPTTSTSTTSASTSTTGSSRCSPLQACGNSCYDPSFYVCFDSRLCPKALRACGEACYDPAVYKCNNGQLSPA